MTIKEKVFSPLNGMQEADTAINGTPGGGTTCSRLVSLIQDLNQLSIKITTTDNNEKISIEWCVIKKVQCIPDLLPFFTELMQCHTDYSTNKVLRLPTIYGSVKTKKCIRQLKKLRIMRFSRKIGSYVIMDGVYKVVVGE
jgi:hypothetical protein